MMLGVSGLVGSSADGADAAAEAHDSGGASGGSSEVGGPSSIPGGGVEEGERSGGGGNRWPRQETLALLKIRSDMDVEFRDSSVKGPLWEEVSRKMAELGFERSAKKCREKFENVYKYYRRTKDSRAAKSDGKTYRFFDQLEALENNPPNTFPPPLPPPPQNATTLSLPSHATVPSISPTPLSVVHPNTDPQTANNPISSSPFHPSQPPLQHNTPPTAMNTSISPNFQPSHPPVSTSLLSNSTSSSTSSDEDIQRRRGRKRKWKDYFERMMKEVIQKQEALRKKFLDTLEKRERDRMAREEAWRMQEMARVHREHDLLVKERSMAAAKDAAVIAFLQKVSDQHNLQIPIGSNAPPQVAMQAPEPANNLPVRQPPQPRPPQQSTLQPEAEQPAQTPPAVTGTQTKILDTPKTDNCGGNFLPASSSRWPKAEVQALIDLRTNLDLKYEENGPKGPLWEEISAAMAKLGYNRSAKRCKEKWENINKYFKKVKESNKKRPEDSKTCPYFHQLEAIYKEKAKNDVPSFSPGYASKLENASMVPIMARPEQQWPLPDDQQQQQDSAMHFHQDHDNDRENKDHEEDEDEDDEEEDEGEGYEIIANKQPSSVTNTVE